MTDGPVQNCTHLDQHLRWLGIRNDHGRTVYMFQCLGCGKMLSSHTPRALQAETRQMVDLSRLAHV